MFIREQIYLRGKENEKRCYIDENGNFKCNYNLDENRKFLLQEHKNNYILRSGDKYCKPGDDGIIKCTKPTSTFTANKDGKSVSAGVINQDEYAVFDIQDDKLETYINPDKSKYDKVNFIYNGKYCSDEGDKIKCDRLAIGPLERFLLEENRFKKVNENDPELSNYIASQGSVIPAKDYDRWVYYGHHNFPNESNQSQKNEDGTILIKPYQSGFVKKKIPKGVEGKCDSDFFNNEEPNFGKIKYCFEAKEKRPIVMNVKINTAGFKYGDKYRNEYELSSGLR